MRKIEKPMKFGEYFVLPGIAKKEDHCVVLQTAVDAMLGITE